MTASSPCSFNLWLRLPQTRIQSCSFIIIYNCIIIIKHNIYKQPAPAPSWWTFLSGSLFTVLFGTGDTTGEIFLNFTTLGTNVQIFWQIRVLSRTEQLLNDVHYHSGSEAGGGWTGGLGWCQIESEGITDYFYTCVNIEECQHTLSNF